ncbi:hypothetical protein CPLU01_09591 [Colletotrichum plurivorum]|uniref:Uncharacterized protein n=1 Tax=Colletotrichum plurivorum TaxID=2175906 RepID=A0A8H6K7Z0_9PEZI|nr:hypothetical protein CPLU01_09591 [Colletotrichum plurivorum]
MEGGEGAKEGLRPQLERLKGDEGQAVMVSSIAMVVFGGDEQAWESQSQSSLTRWARERFPARNEKAASKGASHNQPQRQATSQCLPNAKEEGRSRRIDKMSLELK